MPVKVSDPVKHLRSRAFITVAPHRNPGALAGQAVHAEVEKNEFGVIN